MDFRFIQVYWDNFWYWVKDKISDMRTRKSVKFLKKYDILNAANDLFNAAVENLEDFRPFINQFLDLVKKYNGTFKSEEEYARWLKWQIKQHRKKLDEMIKQGGLHGGTP
ncbi:MAG: hypothetical protein NUV68_05795 [Caldiserica bacterium]|nr:hypothetical protein [Caldisericota bacterium]MDH7562838.1 hypothetical protein [Caldisericota bacterium]